MTDHANPLAAMPLATTKACATCGTEVPKHETNCAICERAAAVRSTRKADSTVLHWIVFLTLLAVIMAGGYALSP